MGVDARRVSRAFLGGFMKGVLLGDDLSAVCGLFQLRFSSGYASSHGRTGCAVDWPCM